MIAAISTTIADTMSQPNAIATPLMSYRKSSLFPILGPPGLASFALTRGNETSRRTIPLYVSCACRVETYTRNPSTGVVHCGNLTRFLF
jgi:hypothetical protein